MKPKEQLFRVVKKDGLVFVDKTGKSSGRGAYVCRDENCIAKLYKNKGLQRAFSCPVEETIFEQMKKEILNDPNGGQ
jgi:Predicted nucleic-acid-binding protein implicated in transcription termination